MQTGVGVDQDLLAAVYKFHEACGMGARPGCDMVESYLLWDFRENRLLAANFIGFGGAPVTFSEFVAFEGSGDPDKRDFSEVNAFYKMACDEGNALACATYGRSLFEGRSGSPEYSEAFVHSRMGCNDAVALGCYTVAVQYLDGRGTQKSIKDAISAFRLACDLNSGDACYWLGNAYQNGEYLARDSIASSSYHVRACTLGVTASCEMRNSLIFQRL